MAQIILDSSNNLIQGDFDNATINNRTKFKTTTTNATTNVYAVPNGSATSAGFTATNAADPTNASKITIATNGSTDTQIISGVNGTGTYLPLSFYTNNALAMQIGTNGQVTVAATANPAFSAYNNSGDTTISSGVYTKILFPTEEFDTNSNFASSRFTPTIPGYYQINSSVSTETSVSLTRALIAIFKNGAQYQRGTDLNTSGVYQSTVSSIVYCNGTTDYIEIWMYILAGTATYRGNGQAFTWITGSMIRSA